VDNPFNESLLGAQAETGRDLSGQWTSLRPLGWAAIVCGLLWIFGLGSLFAIGLGFMGVIGRYRVVTDRYPPPGLWLCVTGLVIGVVGLAATLIVYL
jgi:hypothetical protein